MKKVRESFSEMNQAMAIPFAEKNQSQKTVHASRGPKICKGLDCKNEFVPRRRVQVFCSPNCRTAYFATARKIGLILLEMRKRDPRVIVFIKRLLNGKNGRTSKY